MVTYVSGVYWSAKFLKCNVHLSLWNILSACVIVVYWSTESLKYTGHLSHWSVLIT